MTKLKEIKKNVADSQKQNSVCERVADGEREAEKKAIIAGESQYPGPVYSS